MKIDETLLILLSGAYFIYNQGGDMNLFRWVLATTLLCGASALVSCSDSSSSNDDSADTSSNSTTPKEVGTYLWGSTVYGMGSDGAERLAEAYSKTGINNVILLVKGESGTIGYFQNSLSKAPKTRTDRDMLAEVLDAMHAKDIKVYAWLIVGIDEAYIAEHPEQAAYHFRRGYSESSVDFSYADYQEYMANVIKEIDQNYDVDGFALDNVRYLGAYYGWGESDFKRLTASEKDGGFGLTLEEYNELVKIMAKEYGYPTSKDESGRLVYDEKAESPEIQEEILETAFDDGNKAVKAFGRMREKITDDISEYLVKQTNKPVYIASMPECSYIPTYATLNYGLTFNKAYTFDVVCPMLYSADFEQDSAWVSKNIEYLDDMGYDKIVPSLQAFRDGSTETLAADISASIQHKVPGYLLFRTGTYDIAKAESKEKNTVELTYVRGTEETSGDLTVTVSGAKPTKVTMGGKLEKTESSISGKKIAFNTEALEKMGDYGTVTIQADGEISSVFVESDKRIVYNVPMN